MPKVIDSITGQEFPNYEDYLNHKNPVTGHTPRDIQHHGKRGLMVARRALARTGSLEKRENALNAIQQEIEASEVDRKLRDRRGEVLRGAPAERQKVQQERRVSR